MNVLTAMNAIVSINREIHLYHGRANAIRPYYHPRNPKILKIRDSKPGGRGEFTLNPDLMNDLTAMNAIVSINREMYLYHGRANAIRPYKNGILSSVKSNNP